MYFTAKSDAQSTTNTHTYWSDISKDQETITWNTGTKDLEYKNYQTSNGIISALGSGFSNFNLEKVSFPISFTNDYLYYFETGERLMRMNKKTGESEKVLIKSSVYDKTTIIQNWIYYWNDGYLCRTTENYSKTEKLMESPLISQKELEGLN